MSWSPKSLEPCGWTKYEKPFLGSISFKLLMVAGQRWICSRISVDVLNGEAVVMELFDLKCTQICSDIITPLDSSSSICVRCVPSSGWPLTLFLHDDGYHWPAQTSIQRSISGALQDILSWKIPSATHSVASAYVSQGGINSHQSYETAGKGSGFLQILRPFLVNNKWMDW